MVSYRFKIARDTAAQAATRSGLSAVVVGQPPAEAAALAAALAGLDADTRAVVAETQAFMQAVRSAAAAVADAGERAQACALLRKLVANVLLCPQDLGKRHVNLSAKAVQAKLVLVRGGLDYREAMYVAEAVAETGALGSMDLVEVNPSLQPEVSGAGERTVELGARLVEAALGSRIFDPIPAHGTAL